MNRTRPYLNKFTKHKELLISDSYHEMNMKEMKPITSRLMEHSESVVINRGKQQQLKEMRRIEIERENRVLLMKIESVMGKRSSYSKQSRYGSGRHHHSLNQIYRKKQEQLINQENKRFLARLQSKKPTLDLDKLNKDWKDNKSVIKRMAHYEFYLTNYKESITKSGHSSDRVAKSKLESIKIQRNKVISGHKMAIKVEFTDDYLKITGDTMNQRDLKVIEIPREEALFFLEHDCKGKPEKIMSMLHYDAVKDLLFLVTSIEEETNPEENTMKVRLDPIVTNSQTLQGSVINQDQA